MLKIKRLFYIMVLLKSWKEPEPVSSLHNRIKNEWENLS